MFFYYFEVTPDKIKIIGSSSNNPCIEIDSNKIVDIELNNNKVIQIYTETELYVLEIKYDKANSIYQTITSTVNYDTSIKRKTLKHNAASITKSQMMTIVLSEDFERYFLDFVNARNDDELNIMFDLISDKIQEMSKRNIKEVHRQVHE